jgi:hypothetical protein
MDIKRIIKEEVNEFEWAEEITPVDQLTDKEKSATRYMFQALIGRLGLSEPEALKILAQYKQPRKRFKHEYDEDTTYWTTDHGSSTFQFNYPPRQGTLTQRFVDHLLSLQVFLE